MDNRNINKYNHNIAIFVNNGSYNRYLSRQGTAENSARYTDVTQIAEAIAPTGKMPCLHSYRTKISYNTFACQTFLSTGSELSMNVYLILVTRHSIWGRICRELRNEYCWKIHCVLHVSRTLVVQTRGRSSNVQAVTWGCFITRKSRQIVVFILTYERIRENKVIISPHYTTRATNWNSAGSQICFSNRKEHCQSAVEVRRTSWK
jgi:hypothetical protein